MFVTALGVVEQANESASFTCTEQRCLAGSSFDSRSYYAFQLLGCATYALDRNPKTCNADAPALCTAQDGVNIIQNFRSLLICFTGSQHLVCAIGAGTLPTGIGSTLRMYEKINRYEFR